MSLKALRYDALMYFCNRVVAKFPAARLRHFFYRSVMRIDIAPGAWLLSGIWFDTRGNCSIGKNSVINQDCRLDNRGGIFIRENVSISPSVHLITADHDIDSPRCAGRQQGIPVAATVAARRRADSILAGSASPCPAMS